MCTAENLVLALATLGNMYLRFKHNIVFINITLLHTDNHTQGERV
jgi:hypothetical protein